MRNVQTIAYTKKIINDVERFSKFKITKISKMKFIEISLRTIKDKIVDISNFITRVTKNKNTKYNLSR